MTDGEAQANRLIHETSPYLLQHAHNPVDWYPWGDEALARAQREDKPILLSVGYAACHWCHVMAHESFESEEIAAVMNEHFVCVKVDREERPDLDALYMLAVQVMTGGGGWPMTVFLTPDRRPFYGGTYFPPEDRVNMPGFGRLCLSIAQMYRDEKTNLEERAAEMDRVLKQSTASEPGGPELEESALTRAFNQLGAQFDRRHGGFGSAPKFPQPSMLDFLLRTYRRTVNVEALDMVVATLRHMARGGIYDHLGGGFHRYSTDERWLVPHFEKMLYDNALLPPVYLAAYQLTGDEEFADVARGCLDYVLRDMQADDGGIYSSEDADSEGAEGRFYVWSDEEIASVLGSEVAPLFSDFYQVTDYGNWEGTNILNAPEDVQTFSERHDLSPADVRSLLRGAREALFEVREQRVRPGLDDKVLTGWNGLMIGALAHGSAVLGEERYLDAAERAARFVLETLTRDGRLLRAYRAGEAKIDGFLEDYAYFVRGLIELFEVTQSAEWLREADRLASQMCAFFWDDEGSGFYTTGAHHDELPARLKDSHDGATPSGNAVAAGVLRWLAALTGNEDFAAKSRETLRCVASGIERQPTAFTEMLGILDAEVGGFREIVIVGSLADDGTRRALDGIRRRYLPNTVLAVVDPTGVDPLLGDSPLVQGKSSIAGQTTFYVCRNYACETPTTDVEAFLAQLD